MAQSTETITVANPGPLGLCGFALTLFVLSAVNAGIAPAAATPVVIGLALFYGGFILILAGMWAFRAGAPLLLPSSTRTELSGLPSASSFCLEQGSSPRWEQHFLQH